MAPPVRDVSDHSTNAGFASSLQKERALTTKRFHFKGKNCNTKPGVKNFNHFFFLMYILKLVKGKKSELKFHNLFSWHLPGLPYLNKA